jgi:hypothetical protein
MRIDGIDNLTPEQIETELAAGGRFVFFEYCISFLIITLRCPTSVRFLRANDYGLIAGLPYTVLSLLLGWWGLPWGVIYTPLVLFTNCGGGHDVTDEVCDFVLGRRAEMDSANRALTSQGPAE